MTDTQIRVLLIEDNPGDRRLIREMLSRAGAASFSVECAERLSTGLERLAPGDIDVLLLDLGLPGSAGLDTFSAARARAPEVPIVVLTGLEEASLAMRAVRDGAQDCLFKNELDPALLARSMRYAIARKRTEGHIRHLNSVLKAIRSVNQLIVAEKDRDRLLQKSCDALVDARGYDAAWLGFLTDSESFATVVVAGFGEDVSRFRELVMSGVLPPCIDKALAQKQWFVVVDKSRECGECPFKSAYAGRATAVIPVQRAGRLFGLLAISLAADVAADEQEKGLLEEVAGDIALGLHNMETEEAHRRAEQQLRKRHEELEGFSRMAVGREMKMIDLKKQINALLRGLGREPRYEIVDGLPGEASR